MRIRDILNTYYDSTKKRRRRGSENQLEARRLERAVRRRAVAFRRWTRAYGKHRSIAARMMGISKRTLTKWEHDWNAQGLLVRPRGRPAEHSSQRRRREVFGLLDDLGPHTGLPTLRAEFPDLARGELIDLLREFRCTRVDGTDIIVHTLKWRMVGATWAMDFTEPDLPVDGIYPYIFAVRDLASHNVLMWLPARRATAKVAADALVFLFAVYGIPILIKHDGGSHFKAEVKDLLDKAGVLRLVSPPYTPEFNGSIESGIGNITVHTHYEAARQGRPGEWTVEDLEAARLRTNEMTRPFGHTGPTPGELWMNRPALPSYLRNAFQRSVNQFELDLREEAGYNVGDEIPMAEDASIKREAISRACVAHGLLNIRRRRISLPVVSKKVTIIL